MNKVDLKHYGLYGMGKTGINGVFDFLRSDEAIARRKIRKNSRLDYREQSGQARRDNRFERGKIRREKRLIKAENKAQSILDTGRTKAGNIISKAFDLFKPRETYQDYPTDNYAQTAQIKTTTKSNKMGGWLGVGALAASIAAGTYYFNTKQPKSKK
jgi:hypothetical protein